MKKPEGAPSGMVWVPGGSFQMLSDDGKNTKLPVQSVTLSGFYIGTYEVTQEQYEAVLGSNPSTFTSGAAGEVQEKRPVETVSWYDAAAFCNKLSEQEGLAPYYTIDKTEGSDTNNTSPSDPFKWLVTRNAGANGYRLPTEAQWEYAARYGGNYHYAGSGNVDSVAWYDDNSGNKTHEVGKKAPNGLGLYDMSGNVWEWCWDWYDDYSGEAQNDPVGASSGSYRVVRGGSWANSAQFERSAVRNYDNPSSRHYGLGFRLVRP